MMMATLQSLVEGLEGDARFIVIQHSAYYGQPLFPQTTLSSHPRRPYLGGGELLPSKGCNTSVKTKQGVAMKVESREGSPFATPCPQLCIL